MGHVDLHTAVTMVIDSVSGVVVAVVVSIQKQGAAPLGKTHVTTQVGRQDLLPGVHGQGNTAAESRLNNSRLRR